MIVPLVTVDGHIYVRPTGSGQAGWTAMLFNKPGWMSNTVVIKLSGSGKFDIQADWGIDVIIGAQGYFTAGSTAPGGFVPSLTPFRVADSRYGNGVPQAKLTNNVPVTVQVASGSNGVPASGVPMGASAVFVNFTVINGSTASGQIHGNAADASGAGGGLNFMASANTTLGAVVPLSADGKMKVTLTFTPTTGTADMVADIVGFYTATDNDYAAGTFTPADSWLVNNKTIAAHTTATYSIAGVGGVPVNGSGVNAVAASVVVHQANVGGSGNVSMWPDGFPLPNVTSLVFPETSYRSTSTTIGVGAEGKINVYNNSSQPISIFIQLQGWFAASDAVVVGGQSITQQKVGLKASSVGVAASRPWVTYKYRQGTSGAWTAIPLGNVKDDASGNHPTAWPIGAVGTGTAAEFAPYTWDVSGTLGPDYQSGLSLQVVACYSTGSSDPSPLCATAWNVTYAPASFGYASATANIGPGTLSLLTGDLAVSSSDATAVSSLGGLSIGRTLTTLKDPTAAPLGTAVGVFGPAWTADLDGPDAGEGALTVADHHTYGYLTFTDTDGATYVYQASTDPTKPNTYVGVGDAAGDGVVVTMSTDATSITMVDRDGTVTTYVKVGTTWQTLSIVEPGSATTSSYTYGTSGPETGRVTRILAPVPPGVTCTGALADTTPGCRSLVPHYGTPDGSPAGTVRLLDVKVSIPQTSGTTNFKTVAQYGYDSTGRLTTAWDPRTDLNPGDGVDTTLKTTYTYVTSGNGLGRLASITPPGPERTTSFVYDSNNRVVQVLRNVPVGNPISGVADKTATTTIVYGVPNSGTGLPDLSASAAAAWGQTRSLPSDGSGTAVYGPDHVPASTDVATVSASDWKYA
ncbi:hypothetical protein JCM18899A_55080 [Nocardioides sp. AN3]